MPFDKLRAFDAFALSRLACHEQVSVSERVEWRKGRDSNPRWRKATTVFKTVALDHSATLPSLMLNAFL